MASGAPKEVTEQAKSGQTPRPFLREYRLAVALMVGSGTIALGQQFLWTRRMTDLIGASAASSARVFSCFFLGLALGAATTAWTLPRVRRPWRSLAIVELAAALLSLPSVWLPDWTGWLWPVLGPERLAGWLGSGVKWALSFLLVAAPALFLGMILPITVEAVCRSQRKVSEPGIRLYAFNTLGGVAGLAAVCGLGIQCAGVSNCLLILAAGNLVMAALCWFYDVTKTRECQVGELGLSSRAERKPSAKWPLAVAFFSGAGVLALEVLGLQMINLYALVSFYHPAAILASVILVLALAAGVAPSVSRRFGAASQSLPFVLALAGLLVALVPVLFVEFTATTGRFHYATSLGSFLLRMFAVTLISIGPAVLFAGLVFPLAIMAHGANTGGRGLGLCLAVNGIGGLIGAEVSLRILLPVVGIHVAIGVVGVFYAGLAVALCFWLRMRLEIRIGVPPLGGGAPEPPRGGTPNPDANGLGVGSKHAVGPLSRFSLPITVAMMALAGFIVGGILPRLPVFANRGLYRVIETRCGPEGSLAVVEREGLGRAMILDNQYVLGTSAAAPDMERQTHLPLLLHPNPERVAFIGLGTGISASGALRHGPVKTIAVAELSPLVARASATYFPDFNHDLCAHSNVTILVEDARAHLAAARARYDVIIGDLFTPWRPGEAALCSREQFQAAKDALRPGGIFCQWLPLHQLTPDQYDVIARTFALVFPDTYLFRNHFKLRNLPLALIASKDGPLDWAVVGRRCSRERRRGFLTDPLCRHAEGVAMLYLGRYHASSASAVRINTLGNSWVELDAGRKWICGRTDEFFHAASNQWLEWTRTQLAHLNEEIGFPDELHAYPALGSLAAKWEQARESEDPNAQEIRARLAAGLPNTVLADPTADQSMWPGSQPPFPPKP